MPSFKRHDKIKLLPGAIDNVYGFKITPSASAESKGAIPYGRTVASAVVASFTEEDEIITDLISEYTLVSDTISVALSYPASGSGIYKLKFTLTLDDGSIYVLMFNPIDCGVL